MKKLLRSVFVFVLAFSLVLGTGAFTNVGTINVNYTEQQNYLCWKDHKA